MRNRFILIQDKYWHTCINYKTYVLEGCYHYHWRYTPRWALAFIVAIHYDHEPSFFNSYSPILVLFYRMMGVTLQSIKERITKGNKFCAVFLQLMKFKWNIYKTIIRPIVLYASELKRINRKEGPENKFWNLNENGEWRRRSNRDWMICLWVHF